MKRCFFILLILMIFRCNGAEDETARTPLIRFYNALLSTNKPSKHDEAGLFWMAEGTQRLLRDFSLDVPAASETPLLDFCIRHRYLFASELVKHVADIRFTLLSHSTPTRVMACFGTGGDKSNSVVFAITDGRIDIYSTRVFPPTGLAVTRDDASHIRVEGSGGNLLGTLIEARVADQVLIIVQNDNKIAENVMSVLKQCRAEAVQRQMKGKE